MKIEDLENHLRRKISRCNMYKQTPWMYIRYNLAECFNWTERDVVYIMDVNIKSYQQLLKDLNTYKAWGRF